MLSCRQCSHVYLLGHHANLTFLQPTRSWGCHCAPRARHQHAWWALCMIGVHQRGSLGMYCCRDAATANWSMAMCLLGPASRCRGVHGHGQCACMHAWGSNPDWECLRRWHRGCTVFVAVMLIERSVLTGRIEVHQAPTWHTTCPNWCSCTLKCY